MSPFDNNSYRIVLLIDYACRDRISTIEFDRSSHFLTNLKEVSFPNHGKKNSVTEAKRRLLKKLGCKVISASFMEDTRMSKKGNDKRCQLKKECLKKSQSRR